MNVKFKEFSSFQKKLSSKVQMEFVGDFVHQVHEMLVSKKSESDASLFRDIQVCFSDGTVSYNKILLGVLEPVVIDAMRGMNDLENVTIFFPERSLDCLTELQITRDVPREMENILEAEYEIGSNVSEVHYCSECNRHFSRKKQLTKHYYYKHYGAKQNPSTESLGKVQQSFEKKKNLNLVKNVEKLDCTKCDKTFKRWQGLSRHMETVHNLEKITRFHCNFCNSSFNRKDNLYRHVSRAHKDN